MPWVGPFFPLPKFPKLNLTDASIWGLTRLMGGNEHALLRAILQGDRDAYQPLVLRHSSAVFRVAYRIVGNAPDAEEIVQETFLKAYLQLPKFELRADFGTWVYRIAVNCSLDLLQKQRGAPTHRTGSYTNPAEREIQPVDGAAGPDRLLFSQEVQDRRERAMRTLTELERTSFILRHMEDRSIEEIAQALGMTVNAAKQAIFRAVQKLRKALEPLWLKS